MPAWALSPSLPVKKINGNPQMLKIIDDTSTTEDKKWSCLQDVQDIVENNFATKDILVTLLVVELQCLTARWGLLFVFFSLGASLPGNLVCPRWLFRETSMLERWTMTF